MIHADAKALKQIRDIILQIAPNAEIFAFGSRVRGDHKKYSDLDLALKCPSKLTLLQLDQLQSALSETSIPFKVDVIDLQSVSDEFRNHILSHAVRMDLCN